MAYSKSCCILNHTEKLSYPEVQSISQDKWDVKIMHLNVALAAWVVDFMAAVGNQLL